MKKALFFDIDGTLMNFHGQLPDSTPKALIAAREAGHKIIIATGRSLFQIPDILFPFADGFIAATGAHIVVEGKEIYSVDMTRQQVQKILDFFRDTPAYLNFHARDGFYMTQNSYDRTIVRLSSRGRSPAVLGLFADNTHIVNEDSDYGAVNKAVFFDNTLPIEEVAAGLGEDFDVVPMSFLQNNEDSGEITMRNINKSLGIAKVLEYYGMAWEDSMAFGDSHNDFDMIKYAKVGVAMGNSVPELKELADFVTTDVDDDGIYHAMKHFELI